MDTSAASDLGIQCATIAALKSIDPDRLSVFGLKLPATLTCENDSDDGKGTCYLAVPIKDQQVHILCPKCADRVARLWLSDRDQVIVIAVLR